MAGTSRKIKNDLIYGAVLLLVSLLDLLPYGLLRRLGRVFGSLAFHLAAGERRKTLSNLRLAFPTGISETERRELAVRAWRNIGEDLFMFIRWRKWPVELVRAQVGKVHGLENARKALDRGKGLFFTTAHLGNWELMAALIGKFFPEQGLVVTRQAYDPRLDRMITGMRERLGYKVVQRGLALRGILAALKRNHVVGVLCDQDTGRDGVFVPFFGVPAWTQSGPARIARKTGAAILPAYLVRTAEGSLEVFIGEEIAVPHTEDEEKDVLEVVQGYTRDIERFVRAYPDQWVWMHARWRTRPGSAQEKTQ